jgi:hypothetical protein
MGRLYSQAFQGLFFLAFMLIQGPLAATLFCWILIHSCCLISLVVTSVAASLQEMVAAVDNEGWLLELVDHLQQTWELPTTFGTLKVRVRRLVITISDHYHLIFTFVFETQTTIYL